MIEKLQIVIILSIACIAIFYLIRLYKKWKIWKRNKEINEEIELDNKIAEAIHNNDTILIAKLRKYLMKYYKK